MAGACARAPTSTLARATWSQSEFPARVRQFAASSCGSVALSPMPWPALERPRLPARLHIDATGARRRPAARRRLGRPRPGPERRRHSGGRGIRPDGRRRDPRGRRRTTRAIGWPRMRTDSRLASAARRAGAVVFASPAWLRSIASRALLGSPRLTRRLLLENAFLHVRRATM